MKEIKKTSLKVTAELPQTLYFETYVLCEKHFLRLALKIVKLVLLNITIKNTQNLTNDSGKINKLLLCITTKTFYQ